MTRSQLRKQQAANPSIRVLVKTITKNDSTTAMAAAFKAAVR